MFGNRSRSAEEHIATGYLVTHLCGAMVGLQLSRSLSDSYGVWADGELDSLPGELEYEIEQLLQLIEDTQAYLCPGTPRSTRRSIGSDVSSMSTPSGVIAS
ncbi:hypothetical protein N806_22220 [Rhodococcus sp. P27]|nr:hypothetical protein N806_22220 [Rhodococcus sp. P27]